MDPPLAVQSYFPHYVFCEEYSSSKIAATGQNCDTKSADLHCRIIWYAREGLKRLEIVLPIVANYKELRVLSNKLHASAYHLCVLFHNRPLVSLKFSTQAFKQPGHISLQAVKMGTYCFRWSEDGPYNDGSTPAIVLHRREHCPRHTLILESYNSS